MEPLLPLVGLHFIRRVPEFQYAERARQIHISVQVHRHRPPQRRLEPQPHRRLVVGRDVGRVELFHEVPGRTGAAARWAGGQALR